MSFFVTKYYKTLYSNSLKYNFRIFQKGGESESC